MADRTQRRSYLYEIDGHDVTISRLHTGTAYARNGNAHNPTEYFRWDMAIDGEPYLSACRSRTEAYEHARCRIRDLGDYVCTDRRHRYQNVRNVFAVQEEMRQNYRGVAKPGQATKPTA